MSAITEQLDIKDIYLQGATLREIGSRLGVSYNTIRRRLVSLGVKLRHSGRRLSGNRSERRCHVCLKTLPIDSFYRYCRGANGRDWKCKNCANSINSRNQMMRNFGMSAENYASLLASQNGVCALCYSSDTFGKGKSPRLAIDHSHLTGKVRGILCQYCNIGIGMFRENTEVLRRVITYLDMGNGG